MKLRLYTVIIFALLPSHFVHAQDIESLKDQKAFAFSGSAGAGFSFYNSDEPFASRDPFAWNIYGNFNPRIYGFELPFTFIVTQYSRSYTQPFTQMGISPRYKWVTLHLGYRTMDFSPLVFGGSSFLGAGIELRPGWFRFAAFYGRLNKAVSEDTTRDHRLPPQFGRVGYGLKIGAGRSGKEISFQYFHARDKENSIAIVDTNARLRPQENTVLGMEWKYTFFKRLHFTGAIAGSLLTSDVGYKTTDRIGATQVPDFVSTIHPFNYSSVLSYSGQSRLMLNLRVFHFSVGYRRVQPDFKSLGIPYVLNDIELIQGNIGGSLFKGKLSVNAGYNGQHNNLNGARGSTLQSQNGNLNLNALLNTHFSLSGNVTVTNLHQKDGTLHLSDSMRMSQIMVAYSLAPSFNFGGASHQHNISMNLSRTNLNDRNPATQQFSSGTNLNGGVNYGVFLPQSFKGLHLGVQYSHYQQPASKYESLGLNAGGNAQFLKEHNLSVNAGFGYYFNRSDQAAVNNNITFSAGSSFQTKKHRFHIFASYIYTPPVDLDPMNRVNNVPYYVSTYNFSGGINYSYSF